MSGQPAPPRLLQAFATNAISDDITNPIPQPSQFSINPGAASLNDGFPPQTFTDTASGGQLPSGADFNGILFMATAPVAYLMAGQRPLFDATLAAFMGGYAVGAVVAQSADPTQTWTNTVDGNTNDPDAAGLGWVSSTPVYSAVALPGTNDIVLPGISDYVIDVDTSSGARTMTGFIAQRPWQKVTLCPTGANSIQFNPLTGSAADNQIRLSAGGISILQNDSINFQYIPSISKWVQV